MKCILGVAIFLFAANYADAALIVNRPIYVGLQSGLVGYWSFDGQDVANITAYDRSGQGNNGTLTNGPERTLGKIGQALEFDGSNDYVNISSLTNDIATGNVTVSLWFKRGDAYDISATAHDVVFNFGDADSSNDMIILFEHDTGKLSFWTGSGAGFPRAATNQASWPAGEWHHALGTFSSTEGMKFYVDGVLAATNSSNTRGGNQTTGAEIGTYLPDLGLSFKGIIDDVRVYNRVLSPDEVKRLYRIGGTLKVNKPQYTDSLKNGLVGFWSFDGPDMAGNTAYDRSGNNNNGTLTNGPVRTAGKIGQALEFDGSDDYVDAGSGGSLDNIAVKTVSAWIFPRSAGENNVGRIADKANAVAGWEFDMCGSGQVVCQSSDRVLLQHTTDGTNGQWLSAASSIKYNQWQHVVVIHDKGSLANDPIFYINGVLSATTERQTPTGTAFDDDSARSLRIGEQGNGLRAFDGSIDDVRVYNRIISPDEIKRLYRIGGTLKVNKPLYSDSLKNGLVGYWSFDGPDMAGDTAYDRSGNNNNGTLTNGPTRNAGKIGQALNFDGVNDYVNAVGAADVGTANLTLALWIKDPTVGSVDEAIDSIIHNGADSDTEAGYSLNLSGDNFATLIGNATTRLSSVNNNYTVSTGAGSWHHVVMSWDRSTCKWYIDGALNETDSCSLAGGISDNDNFGIGANADGGGTFFVSAVIDEVRVYNRVLSGDEIKRLYRLGGGR